MTPEELKDFVAIADARKQNAEARLARANKRVAQLRAMLNEMANQFQSNMHHSSDSLSSMRGLGAHQAWVDFTRRRRAAINSQLAGAMAEKLNCEDALRRQLGQRDALDDLRAQSVRDHTRQREAKTQERVLGAYLTGNLSV